MIWQLQAMPLCSVSPCSRRQIGGSSFWMRRRRLRIRMVLREGVSRSYFTRVVRLSYLAPDITQAILEGRQPRHLTAEKLLQHSRLPLAWHDQRATLGFA